MILIVNVLGYCVLSFYQASTAAPPANMPFANSIEQRLEMLQELKEIKELLKQQNVLLRSGEVKVIITGVQRPAEPAPADMPRESDAGN
jgi:hypothetical protein